MNTIFLIILPMMEYYNVYDANYLDDKMVDRKLDQAMSDNQFDDYRSSDTNSDIVLIVVILMLSILAILVILFTARHNLTGALISTGIMFIVVLVIVGALVFSYRRRQDYLIAWASNNL